MSLKCAASSPTGMALTKHMNGPESSRLLGAVINSNDNHNNHHSNSVAINNGDKGGGGDSSIIIEMVSSTQTTCTDDISQPDTRSNREEHADSKVDEDKDTENDDLFEDNACSRTVEKIQESIYSFFRRKKSLIFIILKGSGVILFAAYFIYCMDVKFGDEGSYRLIGIVVVALLILLVRKFPFKYRCMSVACITAILGGPGSRRMRRLRLVLRWVLRVGVVVFMVVFLAVDVVRQNPENLQSLVGLAGFIVVLFCSSLNPAKVNWHPVFWGIAVQWVLALIILRTAWGLVLFEWMGERVHEFLNFGLAGAEFVFGKDYYRHRLAMVTVSIMLFFNSVIYILFHWGVIQAVINSFGRFLAFCLDTNPIESFAASANIFVSLTEAPMMLRPFLRYMTRSELHTVMTCGFASISGGVLGTFVQYGIPANHLLTASVMSAPAALAISKLMCPETKRSNLKGVQAGDIGNMHYRNVLQAASSGAVQATPIAVATLANQIAFVSLLAFANAVVNWFGNRADISDLTFKAICSYMFYPLVFAMGTKASDCRSVGALLGIKLFGTPIMSYTALADLRDNRMELEKYTTAYPNATWAWQQENIVLELTNSTLVGGVISERSEVIATYMLCGFSTITSIGICLGVIVPLAQERKEEVIDLVVRALVAGNFASFLTAAIAGLMFSGKPLPT